MAGGAAVDGDQQRRAAAGERAHRLDVGAVAFEHAVGDMDQRLEAAVAQEARQQSPPRSRRRRRSRRRSRPSRRAPPRRRCAPPPPPCRSATCGSGISARTVGSRKASTSSDLDAAAGQDARQQFRHVVVALRDRQRARRAALVEPVAPGAPARRLLDAEKQAPRRDFRRWDRDIHRNQCQRITVRKAYDTG